jgi:hypothetical protein
MDLRSAKTIEDLKKIYDAESLRRPADKIAFLKSGMKLLATRSDSPDTEDEELTSLEELAISHLWVGLS